MKHAKYFKHPRILHGSEKQLAKCDIALIVSAEENLCFAALPALFFLQRGAWFPCPVELFYLHM